MIVFIIKTIKWKRSCNSVQHVVWPDAFGPTATQNGWVTHDASMATLRLGAERIRSLALLLHRNPSMPFKDMYNKSRAQNLYWKAFQCMSSFKEMNVMNWNFDILSQRWYKLSGDNTVQWWQCWLFYTFVNWFVFYWEPKRMLYNNKL